MEPSVGKNVVICLDGTGNQFKEENSNVVKLFRVLKRDPRVQVAYYDPGVGTLADPDYKTPIAKKINTDKITRVGFLIRISHSPQPTSILHRTRNYYTRKA